MVIFHSYVSLPKGTRPNIFNTPLLWLPMCCFIPDFGCFFVGETGLLANLLGIEIHGSPQFLNRNLGFSQWKCGDNIIKLTSWKNWSIFLWTPMAYIYIDDGPVNAVKWGRSLLWNWWPIQFDVLPVNIWMVILQFANFNKSPKGICVKYIKALKLDVLQDLFSNG
jgi:hypothetical protein